MSAKIFPRWRWPDASRTLMSVHCARASRNAREEMKLCFRGTERLKTFPSEDGNYWVVVEFYRQKICKWRLLPFYTWLLSLLYFTSILRWVQSSSLYVEHDITHLTSCRCFIRYKVHLVFFYSKHRGMLSRYVGYGICLNAKKTMEQQKILKYQTVVLTKWYLINKWYQITTYKTCDSLARIYKIPLSRGFR